MTYIRCFDNFTIKENMAKNVVKTKNTAPKSKPAAKKIVKETKANAKVENSSKNSKLSKNEKLEAAKKKRKSKLDKKIQKIGSDANRSLSRYLQEIGRYEPLIPNREVELAIRVKKGDRAALKELTEANLRFVVSVAKDYQDKDYL